MESTQQQRKKFNTTQKWHDYIAPLYHSGQVDGRNLFELRRVCYAEIEELRGRPLLVYATKFLESVPPGTPNQIDLSDVGGFTDLINSIGTHHKSVDVLLHSPGGQPDATERIVDILRSRFEEVNFLIPHSAYSAATMLALSGNSVVLHPSAILGPIDPQVLIPTKEGMIRSVPAKSILNGFTKAKKNIKDEGPGTLLAYIPLIEKYSLDLFELCEDSEKLSKELISSWLEKYMFADVKNNGEKIKKVAAYFSDYDTHKVHSRPLTPDKLAKFELKLEVAENPLQDLLWEAYILLNGLFNLSPVAKLYENIHGVSWGKQSPIVPSPAQPKPRK